MQKRKPLLLFSAFIFCVFFTSAFFLKNSSIAYSQQPSQSTSAPDEIIVKYKEATPENERIKMHQANKTSRKHRIDTLRLEVVTAEQGTRDEKIKEYRKNRFVAYAEPNFKAQAFAISNDTSLTQQWGLFKINAANQDAVSAWDITVGNPAVKVAILDSGIDTTHADLATKIIGNANFSQSATVNDNSGHGTHVAGIMAAATNNGTGVAGTGYNTALLNGKVLGDNGSGYYSWIASGIIWATDQGASVINLSLGGSSSSLALQDAVNYAWSKGVVIVAAAGNGNSSSPTYPAFYQNVIAVAATDSNDTKASFSNFGSWVDVAAPGVAIFSTYKGNGYATLSGTSMATPFAAGTAALIWAGGTCITNTCVRAQLEKTADPVPGTGTQWAWGRINAYNAVTLAVQTTTPTATPTPTPAKTMTVSDLTMSASGGISRRITGVVSIINETNGTPLSGTTVRTTITSPTGIMSNLSGNTNATGKVTFRITSKEKGVFMLQIISLTKTEFYYHPTLIAKTILIQ